MEIKYGRSVVDDLESRASTKKWTRAELEELKLYYKEKINAINRGIDPRPTQEGSTGLEMLGMFSNLPTATSTLPGDDKANI